MDVINTRPPMWAEIDAEFHVAGQKIVFCWGSKIYNPEGAPVGRELLQHERIHSIRQNGNPTAWWEAYILDKAFRLEEEIPAHRVEYIAWRSRVRDPNGRARVLHQLAARLASPLYGGLITGSEAAKLIGKGLR
jgi:hypothetical protein